MTKKNIWQHNNNTEQVNTRSDLDPESLSSLRSLRPNAPSIIKMKDLMLIHAGGGECVGGETLKM